MNMDPNNKPPVVPTNISGDHPPPYTPYPQYEDYQQYQTTPIYPQAVGPNYGSTAMPATTTIIMPPKIILVGACPACRIGVLEDDYTCLGLLCAILFFPIGILCCQALKNRRCSNCGAYFG
ncbi:hypothetical protein RN001_014958 [Aquatica leii]|uniref:Membrane protein BRI3 n=1 Tax=Aquatica leii TaxID=1421715 RepID=A0AAN7PP14_9COLE|nr:hypothetical protein RN001_014958 [Aquatica leii]